MDKKGSEVRTNNYYTPNAQLRKYMTKKLHLIRRMEEIHAGGGEFPPDINALDNSLRARKNRILNEIVFQAMIDLTYFFGFIAEHLEMQKIFESDIKDLLGIMRSKPENYPSGFMFSSLIRSILLAKGKENQGRDFRLKLNQILVQIAMDKTVLSVNDSMMLARPMMQDDFMRVKIWTELLAQSVRDRDLEDGAPNRGFDLDIEELPVQFWRD